MKNKFFFIFILFLVSATVLADVSAIKISYGGFDHRIKFEPNLYKELVFHVSDAERPATVPITIKGQFAQYVTADPKEITMRPGETRDVKVVMKLPAELPEGIHNIEVAAKEVPLDRQDGAFILMPEVGVSLRIINTKEEYACRVPVFNTEVTENSVEIILNIANDGLKSTEQSYSEFILYGAEDVRLASWKTDYFSVPGLDSINIHTSAELKDRQPGYYRIKGILHCGGETINLDKDILFRAHDLDFNEFRIYKENGMLNIEWDVQNEYLSPVTTWAFVWFYEGLKEVQHYSILPTDIEPLGKKTLSIQKKLEWLDVPPGTFDVKGVLHLKDTQKTADAKITLTEEEVSRNAAGKGGFGVVVPEQEAPAMPEAKEAALKEHKGFELSSTLLVRIFVGMFILILLSLLAYRLIFNK